MCKALGPILALHKKRRDREKEGKGRKGGREKKQRGKEREGRKEGRERRRELGRY
jgi:hypothetical protein